jgi:hypothetical protein
VERSGVNLSYIKVIGESAGEEWMEFLSIEIDTNGDEYLEVSC